MVRTDGIFISNCNDGGVYGAGLVAIEHDGAKPCDRRRNGIAVKSLGGSCCNGFARG